MLWRFQTGAIITFTTDFGSQDAYVASMKGAVLTINPQATLVDISHEVSPQNIPQAAYVVDAAFHYFPAGAVHLVVVDPGVGTERQSIAVKTAGHYFVGPDNGVLTYALKRALEEAHFVTRGVTLATASQIDLGDAVEAVSLSNRRYWRTPISPTFHGRDIFAPVAAHLSLGVELKELGEQIKSVRSFPVAGYQSLADGTLLGRIIHIDRFGNLITDIRDKEVARGEVMVQIGKTTINGLSRTYADKDGLLALIGSNNYLEIAVRCGSAKSHLNSQIGDEVRVRVVQPHQQAGGIDETRRSG
ncbi:MAG: SAM-dependent chlorinase/fluorinase [Chloroflexi bacterium]|nr:SAM-dependent chlorinase/fluorinase [Chloroflexota bacterium]